MRVINRLSSATQFGIGILGHPLHSASEIDSENLRAVREAGATVVGVRATAAERATSDGWVGALRANLEEVELRCAQLVSEHELLIAHSEDQRRRAVATVAEGIPVAAALGAETLLIAPGGFSTVGPWWYHPLNFAQESRNALVTSLRELAEIAEEHDQILAVEGYRSSAISSPQVFDWLFSEISSPALRANLDYVNFIAPSQVSELEPYLEELVVTFGERIATVHAKDVVIADELSAHIDEVPPGHGLLAMEVVVHLAQRHRLPLLLEHLEDWDALSHLREFAGFVDQVVGPSSPA